ncbi:hypothetical protein HMPREF0889_1160 [Megasphaera lornae]|uniref:LUD domain-containing protein n=1 Tax=Megasphaera lornae TaxID=1000568 RepID=D3LW19_9FIRM|nr:lactate utilization protein [Megasphaera genomosp. type_1]EFD93486.1 hypothetical protein HMPREF0889_1160 [Megasphaera genomosp. type_1 str. 28L]
MSASMQTLFQKQAPLLIKNFQSHGFAAFYCPTAAAAVQQTLQLIPPDHRLSWGGSATLTELGLPDLLRRTYVTLDREQAATPAARQECMRQALLCDTYLMSTNAATVDGELYNIDGNGNRLAALLYGPKQVIILAGMNKVVPDLAAAEKRARTVAAPLNMQRFQNRTPCRQTGFCSNCNTADSICNQFVYTRRSQPAGRIKIIFVGESLGF